MKKNKRNKLYKNKKRDQAKLNPFFYNLDRITRK